MTDGADPLAEERTDPEERLRRSGARLRNLFDHAPTGIAVTDWDGRFEDCNPAYTDLVGRTQDELRSLTFPELVHPDDRSANVAQIERLRAGEIPFLEIENRYLRPDGTSVWVHKFVSVLDGGGGRPAHLMALVSDVTERRRLDELLRASEERFRSVFEHAAVGVAHVDVDGRFVRVNDAFSVITGRARHELEGRSFADITHPDDLDLDLQHVEDLRSGRIDRYTLEKRYLRPDGGVVWVGLTGSIVRTADGRPDHFVAVIEDVTAARARRGAEQRARQRAELSAEAMARMEAAEGESAQARALVEALVPRFADYATVEAPDDPDPVLAALHRDPQQTRVLWELRLRHRVGREEPGSVARAAGGERQLITEVTSDVLGRYDLDDEARRLLHRLSPRSHMSVPIDLGGGRSGALMVGRTDADADPYDGDDLAFLESLAQAVGVFLARAHLRREEHRIALRLQQALLPGRLAATPTLQVAGRYFAATEMLEVGGDWFDSIELPDGRILVVVGDVVGHGLDAAAVMGRLRAGLAALAARDPHPGRLLVELDRFARSPQGADLATVCCAVIDPVGGHVRYASAGHPPMLVARPDGTVRRVEGGRSAPLCTFPLDERPDDSTDLEPGSLLLLYSDGLVERRGEPFEAGLERLERALARQASSAVGDVCDALIDELTAGGEVEDDVVALCVRFAPADVPVLRRVLDADPSRLADLRAEVRAWFARVGVAEGPGRDVLLALGEACANAIEHAYVDGGTGTVEVELRGPADGLVRVRVRDHGRWRPPGRDADRGRGTGIMEAIGRDLRREVGADGTVVTFSVPVDGSVGAGGRPGARR